MERGRRRRGQSYLMRASSPHGNMSRKVSGSPSRFHAVQGKVVCIRAYLRMSLAGQGERAEWGRNVIWFTGPGLHDPCLHCVCFAFPNIEVDLCHQVQMANGNTLITIFCTQPTVRQSNFLIHVPTLCDTEGQDYAVHTLNQAMKSTCTTGCHP